MIRTSFRNPPHTGYRRPQDRKFYVWQDRHITYPQRYVENGRRGKHPWRWLCTLCDPPSAGFRSTPGAYEMIMTVSMPRHFAIRGAHHRWVSRQDSLAARGLGSHRARQG